jgi:dihydrofolate synthase/folylpolyglutamate synthase
MHAVTPGSRPLSILDELLDNERRTRFFSGDDVPDPTIARRLLAALEPLSRPAVSIHVAGSEGKTSTTERLAAGLSALGLRTGAFTSPHLHDPLERLRIDGQLPPGDAARRAAEAVLHAARDAGLEPSWFDAMTATARLLFAHSQVEAVVWETGLGGRLDSTRAVPADVCLITSISLEHTAVLGADLPGVAREKAGILRQDVPLMLPSGLPRSAHDTIVARAAELDCPVVMVPSGEHAGAQQRSTDLALATLQRLSDDGLVPQPNAVSRRAVTEWAVAGRGERRGDVLFDGAHSVAAIRELAGQLGQAETGPVVFAATSGRDAVGMAALLLAVSDPLIITAVPGPRGSDPVELTRLLRERFPDAGSGLLVEPDPHRALASAKERSRKGRQIVVTGSLYLVGLLLPDRSSPC